MNRKHELHGVTDMCFVVGEANVNTIKSIIVWS
jgi:hypothetical protein